MRGFRVHAAGSRFLGSLSPLHAITSRSYKSQADFVSPNQIVEAGNVCTLGYREWQSIVHAHENTECAVTEAKYSRWYYFWSNFKATMPKGFSRLPRALAIYSQNSSLPLDLFPLQYPENMEEYILVDSLEKDRKKWSELFVGFTLFFKSRMQSSVLYADNIENL